VAILVPTLTIGCQERVPRKALDFCGFRWLVLSGGIESPTP
jgi:hypothetical protein